MLTTFNPELEDKETPVYEKFDPLLHGASRRTSDQILSVEFMKKYISVVKCMKPKLTEQACELISNEYSRLRSQEMTQSDVARTQPVTARTLETLIRLSTAYAKARMAKTVSTQDAKAAIELVQYAYFKKVLEKEKKKRRRGEDMDGVEEEFDDDDDDETATQSSQQSKRTRTVEHETEEDEEMLPLESPADSGDVTQRDSITVPSTGRDSQTLSSTSGLTSTASSSSSQITESRLAIFKNGLQRNFRESRESSLPVQTIVNFINKNSGDVAFTESEVTAALEKMNNDNQIMVADEIVFLI